MQTVKDMEKGQQLTSSLRPLAAVLNDHALATHCSACLNVLPVVTDDEKIAQGIFLYCTMDCAINDRPDVNEERLFTMCTSSSWDNSSVLRLSFRLSRILLKYRDPFCPSSFDRERIFGLMTNWKTPFEEYENAEYLKHLMQGVRFIAKARENNTVDYELEKMVLSCVLTNAVNVMDINGDEIGLALFDHRFSWINHSCTPNACLQFLLGHMRDDKKQDELMLDQVGGDNLPSSGSYIQLYGPRLSVISLKSITKDEEVTISYIDVLQIKVGHDFNFGSVFK